MKHFTTQELVPHEAYNLLNEQAIKLIDNRLIETLDFIREALNKPIIVNNWHKGGSFNNRGFRAFNSTVGAEKSAHKEGLAADFDVIGMEAEQVREWLKDNAHILPYPIRVESGVHWVHIDLRAKEGHKVYFFKP